MLSPVRCDELFGILIMATGKTCGNCKHFVRIKLWGGGRNGLCGKLDYNCNTGSPYAKQCKHYQAIKYEKKSLPNAESIRPESKPADHE